MAPGVHPKKCKRGHTFTPANTYVRRDGYRECRRCNNARKRQVAMVRLVCPDCRLEREVQGRLANLRGRRYPDLPCQSCAQKRSKHGGGAVLARLDYEQFWLDRFSLEEIRELWADVSLYLAMDERGRMAA